MTSGHVRIDFNHPAVLGCRPKVFEYDWLCEQQFGVAQGSLGNEADWDQTFPLHGEQARQAKEHGTRHFALQPEGETRAEVAFRAHAVLGSAFREHAQNGSTDFILATHGVTLRQIVKALLKLPYEASDAEKNPGNCDIRLLQRPAPGQRFADFGYVLMNGQAQPPRQVRRDTTQELFATNAYQWKPPQAS